jgi:hypothetical protein
MPGMDETSLRKLLDSALAGRPPMGPVAHNALRAGLRLRRRRRIQGAAGGVAAAAIIAAAIPATIGILGHTPGPAAGHRPAGLAGAPKFFAGVAEKPPGQIPPVTVVNIYRSATGRVAGSIRPPKPYRDFSAVSRLGGDRTYVAAAITSFNAPACTAHLFRFSIDGQGHPSGLTPLSVPEVTTGRMAELVSSADGKTLAFTASGCAPGLEIGLINLATRQTTTWIVPHRDHIPVSYGSLSLTADGTRLGFLYGVPSGDGPNAYVLPTDSPAGPVMRHARKIPTVATYLLRMALSNNGAQAYVEMFSQRGAVLLSEYSTTTGQQVRVVGQLSPRGRGSTVYSVTMDAAGKHLLAYGSAHQLKAVNLTTGRQASVTVTQVPSVDTAYNTAAW